MAEKRRGLGRGLGALISAAPQASAGPNAEAPAESEESAVASGGNETAVRSAGQGERRRATQGSKTPAARERSTSQPAQTGTPASAEAGPGESSAAKRKSGTSASSATKPSRKPVAGGERGKSAASSKRARPVDMFFATTTPEVAKPVQRRSVPDVLGSASAKEAQQELKDTNLVTVPGARFEEVPVEQIHPNRKQPRSVFDEDELAELVHSIREVGLLQPIVVRASREAGNQPYELVMGERRWRAAQEAGMAAIPAIVRETEDADLLRDALLENLHRSQLNPLEEAAAYQQLMAEFACSQEELSTRIGRSRPQISNTIRLLRLPALVQRRVAAGVLSAGHARALLGLDDQQEIEKLAQRIVNEGLSVRATEELVQLAGSGEKRAGRKKAEPVRHERLDFLATSLQDRLDTNVKITLGARKGKVQIDFASVDDLNRIMELISPED